MLFLKYRFFNAEFTGNGSIEVGITYVLVPKWTVYDNSTSKAYITSSADT